MTTAQQLINDGLAIENPNDSEEVIINIPIRVKKELIDLGGLEQFAGVYGWTPTVNDENGVEITNPVTVTDSCKQVIINFTRDVFDGVISRMIDEEADQQKAILRARWM